MLVPRSVSARSIRPPFYVSQPGLRKNGDTVQAEKMALAGVLGAGDGKAV